MPYQTIDYIPDLTIAEMAGARTLAWAPYTDGGSTGWDYEASVSGFDQYALLHGIYRIDAIAGATYDIASVSYFDPFILLIYDQFGNCIAANDEADDPLDYWLGDAYYGVDAIWNVVAPYTGTFYIQASWDQGSYYTFYNLSIYEDLGTVPPAGTTVSGTNFNDALVGTSGNDFIAAFDGNDSISIVGGSDTVDGGNGIDTVLLPGTLTDYLISRNGNTATLASSSATISLVDVERIFVGGVQVAIDVDGNAGQAYRLYQAAFNRVPDLGGLGYQMHDLDIGVGLLQVANNFIASPEFQATYGNVDNQQFITLLYHNVLHREPDAGGLQYHLDEFAQGQSRAMMLIHFSESPENQANVLGAIDHGMIYIW